MVVARPIVRLTLPRTILGAAPAGGPGARLRAIPVRPALDGRWYNAATNAAGGWSATLPAIATARGDDPDRANLSTRAGLAAAPFRTDQW